MYYIYRKYVYHTSTSIVVYMTTLVYSKHCRLHLYQQRSLVYLCCVIRYADKTLFPMYLW